MAFIVFSGQPSSGKTRLATELQRLVEAEGRECRVISEEGLNLQRDACYQDAMSEKITRGQLKAEVDRGIGKQRVLILDSLNAIKGYRYELHCIARTAAVRYCMVHVNTPLDDCRRWNEGRGVGHRYSQAVFEDLACRFERPDSRQRWDAPLFTISPASDSEAEVAAQLRSVLVSALDLAQAQGNLARDSMQPPVQPSKVLAPTMATTNAKLSSTNLLHEIDRGTNGVIEAILAAQALRPGVPAGTVAISDAVPPLRMRRVMHMAELRRHKRSFLRLVTNMSLTKAPDAVTAQRMFADFLGDQLAQT